MLPADWNGTPCAASERSQHADSVPSYATDRSKSHSFYVLRIPHGTNRLLRRQVAMLTDDTQPPTPPNHHHNPASPRLTCDIRTDREEHAPASVRLDQTQSDSNQTEWSKAHWECESGRGQPAAFKSIQVHFTVTVILCSPFIHTSLLQTTQCIKYGLYHGGRYIIGNQLKKSKGFIVVAL